MRSRIMQWLSGLACLVAAQAAFAAPATVTLDDSSGAPGGSVTVSLHFAQATGANAQAFGGHVDVLYDPSALNVVSSADMSMTSGEWVCDGTSDANDANLDSGRCGSGQLSALANSDGTITFQLAPGAIDGSTTSLTLACTVQDQSGGELTGADACDATDTATVTISTGPKPHLSVSPPSLAFGNQTDGTTSSGMTVTATNDGASSTTLNISSAMLVAGTDFAISNDGCSGQALATGATCQVIVTLNPSSSGTKNDFLIFASDGGCGCSDGASAALSGTGTAAQPVLTADPAAGSGVSLFGAGIGDTATGSITVSNTGGAGTSVTVGKCMLADPTGFGAVTTSNTSNVASGGSGTIGLSCSVAARSFSTTLSCDVSGIDSDSNPASMTSPVSWDVSCVASSSDVPTLDTLGLAVLGILLALVGLAIVRRS